MNQIALAVVSFVLTGLIANRLVQLWQQRNWIQQQRFLGLEKEYVAVRDLAGDISQSINIRKFHMLRLIRVPAAMNQEQFAERISRHDAVVVQWNERLPQFFVKLKLLCSYDMALRLEHLQEQFVSLASEFEESVADRRNGKRVSADLVRGLSEKINHLQGEIIAFDTAMLVIAEGKRTKTYFGEVVPYSPRGLTRFSTYQLIKALFISSVDSHAITCPPTDLLLPPD